MPDNHQASSEASCSVPQSCPALCDPIDCSPQKAPLSGNSPGKDPGKRVAISTSSGSSRPSDWNACLLPLLHCRWILYAEPPGKPLNSLKFAKSKHVSWVAQPLLCSCLPSESPRPPPPRDCRSRHGSRWEFQLSVSKFRCLLQTDGVANQHHPCFT